MVERPGRLAQKLPWLALILLLAAPAAQGHARLEASNPSPGEALPEGARVLALRFTESLDPAWTTLTITDADGRGVPAKTQPAHGDPQLVRFQASPLPPGAYTASWTALSVDGDLTHGHFPFTVGQAAAAGTVQAEAWDPDDDQAQQAAAAGLLRTATVAGLLLTAGAGFFWLRVQRLDPVGDRQATLILLLPSLAAAGALGALLELGQRLDTTPLEAATTPAGGLLGLASGASVLVAGLAGLARWGKRSRRQPRLQLAVVLAGLGLLVVVLGGHAVAGGDIDSAWGDLVLLATAVHVAGVTLWAGGLLGITVSATRSEGPGLAALIRGFSPWALVGVVLLAASGLLLAVDALERPQALWTTSYGGLLVAKSLGLAVLLAFGAWQRSRGRRRAQAPGGPRQVRRRLAAEGIAMGLVLLLASTLAVSPQPASPVDPEPPLALVPTGLAHDLRLGTYQVTLLLPDPPTVRPDQRLWVEATSRSLADPASIGAQLTLQPPGASAAAEVVALQPIDAGRWLARGSLFDQAGPWQLTVHLDGPHGPETGHLTLEVGLHPPEAGG